jgi:hypothetical protein
LRDFFKGTLCEADFYQFETAFLMKKGEEFKKSFRFVQVAPLPISTMITQTKRLFAFLLITLLMSGLSFTVAAQEAGFVPLFDGKTLNGWQGNTGSYQVSNGTILVVPQGGGGGNLLTEKEYGDFVLRFEFQLSPGANNGLGFHTPLTGDAAYVGKELQVLDSEHPKYAALQAYQYHGSLYGVMTAKRGHLLPTGEWNQQEVRVQHPYVTVTLNGVVILEGNYLEASKNGTLDKKEHPGLQRNRGHLGFLGHGDVVSFRNIRLKELP